MVLHGDIAFPIPSSYEEYTILHEIKSKILYYLFQQYSNHGLVIKQIVLWSIEINEGTKSLRSWDHLDVSDYTLILTEEDFVKKPWSTTYYVNSSNDKYKNVSPDIILYFEQNNTRHMQNVKEILKFGPQKIISNYEKKSELIQTIISAERILNIKW